MKNLIPVASLSALLIGAAIPAHAATFAYLSGLTVGWTRSGSGPVTGTFNVSGNDNLQFAIPGLPTNILGQLQITASETGTDASHLTAPGVDVYVQQGISGSFNELYEGASPLTINGVTLTAGDSILSGNLDSGTFSATKLTIGSTVINEQGQLTFQASGFSSPVIDFGTGDGESLGFTIALGSNNWGVTQRNGINTLNSFSGTATGQYLAASVTEPAGWMLMLGGGGLTGAVLRRRRMVGLPA